MPGSTGFFAMCYISGTKCEAFSGFQFGLSSWNLLHFRGRISVFTLSSYDTHILFLYILMFLHVNKTCCIFHNLVAISFQSGESGLYF